MQEEVEPHQEDILHHEEHTSLKFQIFPLDAGKFQLDYSLAHSKGCVISIVTSHFDVMTLGLVKMRWLNMNFRWQDLKDEIRAQTKIECSFCEIHTPRDREGIGKMTKWYISIHSFLVCFNRKDEMKDVLKRMDGFELKGRKLELRPVSNIAWFALYQSTLHTVVIIQYDS